MEKQPATLDEVLEKFGLFKSYHLRLLICVLVAFASNSVYWSNYIFAVEETSYRCLDERFGNNTCLENSIKCTEWIYENPYSFVAEFQLACQEWKRTLVGTIHSLGYMVGLLLVGPLSDRIGRKKTAILLGVLGGVFGLVRSFTWSYWTYIVLEFMEAAIGDICSPMYVLNIEIVASKKRAMYYGLSTIGYIIGNVILPLAAWGVPYWRTFLRVIYTPAFLFFSYIYLLDESPRWLLIRGKKEEAIIILEKIANENKIKIDKDLLDNLPCGEKDIKIKFVTLLKMTFMSRALLKRCLICIVWWMASTFVNYGTLINIVSLQGNKYVNYALVSIIELPGSFILIYILAKFNRRKPLILSFLAGAAFCFVQPFLPLDLPWLSVIAYMASKLFSMLYFNITYIYTSELFPTYTRNSMHALCSSIGRIGSIIAPQTPLLNAYWPGLPSIVFGGAAIVAGLLAFLVPDTAGNDLPDTVDQAEAFESKPLPLKLGIDNLAASKESINQISERRKNNNQDA